MVPDVNEELQLLFSFYNKNTSHELSQTIWHSKCEQIKSFLTMKNIQDVSEVLRKLITILKIDGNFELVYTAEVLERVVIKIKCYTYI